MRDPAARPGLSIAVVMCTYNGERFIAEQLHSIFSQTRPPDHLVIVDDVSTDDTYRLVEQLCVQRPAGMRLTLERNLRNLGYVANFDRALGLADEDLLFLCDQDDVWHPSKIERMEREFMARPDLDLLHTDARLVDASGAGIGCGLFEALELSAADRAALQAGRGYKVVLRHSVVTGATTAVRRRAARRAAPFPAHWIHDEWLAVTSALAGRIDCLGVMLIDYRQHSRSQIGAAKRSVYQRLASNDLRRGLMRRREMGLEVLVARIEAGALVVNDERLLAVYDCLRHARVRANLRDACVGRLWQVTCEALRGGYTRHSFGFRSAVADMLGLR